MTLPATPPQYETWDDLVAPIKRGESGWRVWALQVGLTELGKRLSRDGAFGPNTETVLRGFQREQRLTADAIAGPATQARIIAKLGSKVHAHLPGVPDGLMRGYAEGEGANVLAATNWTVPKGVDCGPMQLRVYGPPFAITTSEYHGLSDAFDPLVAMTKAAEDFLGRVKTHAAGAWVKAQGARSVELAKRCAVLAHNWPVGALSVARTGLVPSPDARCAWAPRSAKFPDGTPVVTRQQWAQFYALGSRHGEGAITKYVTDWS